MFGRAKAKDLGERVPIYKPASCLGEACKYFLGSLCNSRYELLESSGESGGQDKGPLVEHSSYALYGKVCTGGYEQVVVQLYAESPNHQGSTAELIARSGGLEGSHIVLTTSVNGVKF